MDEKLKMHSVNKVDENIKKIGELFPNCLTERLDENGRPEQCIDFDMLKQELSSVVVEGNEERYQFTWPDKKKSILLANAPINKTLRPCREESVDFDNTENLYIEGDNLEVLKLLQETYLGKIKMIYIDPPYNTGNDFVYEDDFAVDVEEWKNKSGDYDEQGNRLFKNTDSNGRFHTDWLNMIYPRLKLAKDLLADDGVIFISIDDNEFENLRKICNEIFGSDNFIAVFPRLATKSGKTPLTFMVSHDYVLCYTKNRHDVFVGQVFEDDSYKFTDEFEKERGKYNLKQPLDCNSISYSAALDYPIVHNGITYYPGSDYKKYIERQNGKHQPKDFAWRWSKDLFQFGLENGWIVFQNGRIYTKGYLNATIEKQPNGSYTVVKREKTRKMSTIDFISNAYSNDIAKKQLVSHKIPARFDFPKPVDLIKALISTYYDKDSVIIDFFSGSGTTAEAVFKQNFIDGGHRKFILVQLPEETQDESYKTICEIGKERIRRAGAKINSELRNKNSELKKDNSKSENDEMQLSMEGLADKDETNHNSELPTMNFELDTGFRVLKLDSSNMKDVYYSPDETDQEMLHLFADNIKEDRTPEDLLFQVMLDLGVLLSSKIEEINISDRKVFNVEDNFLIACFDANVTDDVITEIAKKKPYYFVTRDSSMSDDSVATNFDQIFATYSPDTIRKVL